MFHSILPTALTRFPIRSDRRPSSRQRYRLIHMTNSALRPDKLSRISPAAQKDYGESRRRRAAREPGNRFRRPLIRERRGASAAEEKKWVRRRRAIPRPVGVASCRRFDGFPPGL
ncbi:hypothetical protein GWI33_020725 [Rhynchophorus ferrugineus]|uniref:Uncharacterized protein n=1 Tax=Rhynchophorus ferrugineus TaxID=354439 RepID=A0A834M0B0_RHYFE|nr:hypothetical protein GWI33_020725 [Rhynchophorus ferrugineus]